MLTTSVSQHLGSRTASAQLLSHDHQQRNIRADQPFDMHDRRWGRFQREECCGWQIVSSRPPMSTGQAWAAALPHRSASLSPQFPLPHSNCHRSLPDMAQDCAVLSAVPRSCQTNSYQQCCDQTSCFWRLLQSTRTSSVNFSGNGAGEVGLQWQNTSSCSAL